jgi:hypothetical protein
LLAFYEQCPHEVIYLGRNVGPRRSLFHIESLESRLRGRDFVYTDPDVVPIAECPLDAVDRFFELLARYPAVSKVGFGLKIDDIPRTYRHRRAVLKWEAQFWKEEAEPGVFSAGIDTTFALYRHGLETFSFDALRTGWPYLARHLTWYADSAHPSDEELFYQRRDVPENGGRGWSHWSGVALPDDYRAQLSWRSDVRRLRGRLALGRPLCAIRSRLRRI